LHFLFYQDYAFLAILLDGHGGDCVSTYLSEHVVKRLRSELMAEPDDLAAVLRRTFIAMENELASHSARYQHCGSTATAALISPTTITLAHVGDSRAFLVSDTDEVTQLTQDHRPDDQSERSRIKAAGGSISWRTPPRVNGVLALTRSIGYYGLRDFGVIAEPDVVVREIDSSHDMALVLVSDGVGDVVPVPLLCDAIRTCGGDPMLAAEAMIAHATDRKSHDNMSAIVIPLPAWHQ
jgi:serine/threonine protein phosphatase PrpC